MIGEVIRQFSLVVLVSSLGAPTGTRESSRAIDLNATATFAWSVPDRYDRSWEAWDEKLGEYDTEFVNPKEWPVKLDGCASTAGSPINRYKFTITGYDELPFGKVVFYRWTHAGSECQVDANVPRLGFYTAELELITKQGVSEPRREIINVQDYLIASIGDSFASGEGNPDEPGVYVPKYESVYTFWEKIVSADVIRPAIWKDEQCHRSSKSGHAQLAKMLEDKDSHWSVTYLSFACSGADLEHLIDTRYAGQVVKQGQKDLRPQIEALELAVGAHAPRGGRRVDALLMTGGINDLRFSDIIEECAASLLEGCVTDDLDDGFNIGDGLQYLSGPSGYDLLGKRLRDSTLNLGETYFVAYPSRIFDNGGCGLLGQGGVGISREDGGVMAYYGYQLNNAIERATEAFGWNYLRQPKDVVGLFSPHPYCNSVGIHDVDSWFVSNEDSWRFQGDEVGTSHPNVAGHRAVADLLLTNVFPEKNYFAPFKRVKVIIDAVSYSSPIGQRRPGKIVVDAYKYDNESKVLTSSTLDVQNLNGTVWPNLATELDIYHRGQELPPRLQRSRLRFRVRIQVPNTGIHCDPTPPQTVCLPATSQAYWDVGHTWDDLFGFGRPHELRSGPFAVTYHVEVEAASQGPSCVCPPSKPLCICQQEPLTLPY